MATHQVVLERRQLLVADVNIRELAEACGDAIHNPAVIDDGLDDSTGSRHLSRSFRMERYTAPVAGNFTHVLQAQRLAIEQQRVHIIQS